MRDIFAPVREAIAIRVPESHKVPIAIVGAGEIAAQVVHGTASRAQLLDHVDDVGVGTDAAEREVPAIAGEGARHAQADAAGAAGDQRGAVRGHLISGPKNVR